MGLLNRNHIEKPDYFEAQKHAFLELDNLPKILYFHTPVHTKDVLRTVETLASLEKCTAHESLLLRTAAVYHDVGYVFKSKYHEKAGADLVRQVLPSFGYSPTEIKAICQMILATELPQSPKTKLEQLLCDADLDNLGRKDFFVKTELLRLELMNYGVKMSPRQWYTQTLKFLEDHTYFTPSAIKLRQKRKEQNILEIKELLGLKD